MVSRTTITSQPELPNTTIIIEGSSTSGNNYSYDIEVDYTPYVRQISYDITTILARVSDIANNTLRTAEATENIESHQLNMRNDLHHLRILGDHNGSGIRMTSPYGWLTNAYYYKWFITQGHIYESEFDVDTASLAASIAKMNEYMGDMGNNFPGVYSFGGADTDEQPLSSPPN